MEKIKVLMVEPEKAPREAEIENSLESLQSIVGGYIEATYPFSDPVAIICNEEGKLQGMPLNRSLRDENGSMYDVVAGAFIVCGLGDENFSSLSPEMLEKYKAHFRCPEVFFRTKDGIQAMKIQLPRQKPSRNKEMER
jgi:hypothetical protein